MSTSAHTHSLHTVWSSFTHSLIYSLTHSCTHLGTIFFQTHTITDSLLTHSSPTQCGVLILTHSHTAD